MTAPNPSARPGWVLFIPKLVIALREGYTWKDAHSDAVAGLTVAIVALPLSMALAIASGAPPERGLYTAIVAGFLISALGGVRHQIGGPAGAFVVVVSGIISDHGYAGLVIATIMAGCLLVAAGFARLGTYVKYVPYPVITGFTSGIALIIFTTQFGDLLGLKIAAMPTDFIGKWSAYIRHFPEISLATILVAGFSMAFVVTLRRLRPELPGFLITVAMGALVVAICGLDVQTIGDRFGGIPSSLPSPAWPDITWSRVRELFPSAFTIAFLAGIESLLCAVVADGMTGRRHRSNVELVAQGVANIGSAVMGGLPATGAIARTATNIRAGAVTPIAGIIHSLLLLAFMLLLAPLAKYLPLASLAVVLAIVAWNMSEIERFRSLLRGPTGEAALLVVTFSLTVLVDLTVAIEVGMVMAALLFMHRMAKVVEISTGTTLIDEDIDDLSAPRPDVIPRASVPGDIEVYQINGPFFFGAAGRLADVLTQMRKAPRVTILQMGRVPLIDASGIHALQTFVDTSNRRGTRVILSGLRPALKAAIDQAGMNVAFARNLQAALELAESHSHDKLRDESMR